MNPSIHNGIENKARFGKTTHVLVFYATGYSPEIAYKMHDNIFNALTSLNGFCGTVLRKWNGTWPKLLDSFMKWYFPRDFDDFLQNKIYATS